MPSRSVDEFRSPAVQTAANSPRASLATVVSICDSPAFLRTLEDQPNQSSADGLGCARGIRPAFVLEGGCALLLYGIWLLWHLIH